MKKTYLSLVAAGVALISGTTQLASADPFGGQNGGEEFEGAVYAMSNSFEGNTIVAYGRQDDGLLSFIGETSTGGIGAAFDGGEGLDPLISAYALTITDNRQFVLAVNAGSNTVSALRIDPDLGLTLTDQEAVHGVGPNSIAYRDGRVYVSSIDADGSFNGEPDQEGALTAFVLTPDGDLQRMEDSVRLLNNRPSAVQVSPDGRHLVVTSINAGSAALAFDNDDEIVVFSIDRQGALSPSHVDAATSTRQGNAENRNLPSAIGFEIVEDEGEQFVVVTEAREFQADGSPPAFPALQTGSVSTWRLTEHGILSPVNLDVMAGNAPFDGERTACWIEFAPDLNTFWVSNALDASLSTYSFNSGEISLLQQTAATGAQPDDSDPFGTTDGWIDLWSSDNGEYLYQLYGLAGTIGVFKVEADGGLTLLQEVTDLPEANTQGIVAF